MLLMHLNETISTIVFEVSETLMIRANKLHFLITVLIKWKILVQNSWPVK